MFKVQENGDGSTSIFCSNTGTLICTIKSQQKNMGLGCRPVNVVEPSPQPRSHCYNLNLKSNCSSDDEEKLLSNRRSISPLPDEPNEDYSEECITPEQFARCLNLVPTNKFKTTPLEEINATFPLRMLSRTKSFQISEELHDVKLPDDLPVTSTFGGKILKLNSQKNYYCDQTIALKIKNYDSFCRFQLNTHTVCSNFPKLRCREKKEYPVLMSQKISKSGPSHTYTFNRRQRLEKMITFKTGLNARSRKLLQQCKRKLAIPVKRVSAEELQMWLMKKSGVIRPITMDCIKDEEIVVDISDDEETVIDEGSLLSCTNFNMDSSTDAELSSSTSTNDSDYSPSCTSLPNKLSFKGALSKSEKLSPSRSKNEQYSKIIKNSYRKYRDCYVQLSNILTEVSAYLGHFYVRGTRIRVPFFSEYLDSFNSKLATSDSSARRNLMPGSRYDHAYHKPFGTPRKRMNSPCLIHQSLKTKSRIKEPLKLSNSVKNKSKDLSKLNHVKGHVNSAKVIKSKDIPVIDLTTDSPPKQNKYTAKWIFHCYGCGFKRAFMAESSVKTSGIDHLKKFHCVSDPESFLSMNPTPSGVVLEAFPGYKGSMQM